MSNSHTIKAWSSEIISQDTIALITGTAGELIAGASDKQVMAVLRPEEFGAFIELHANAVFLSLDVTDLFWKLNLALQTSEQGQTRTKMRELVEEGRWVDLQLLCNQVHDAYLTRKKTIPNEIAQFRTTNYATISGRIKGIVQMFNKLNEICQVLTKEATPILPLRHDEYLA